MMLKFKVNIIRKKLCLQNFVQEYNLRISDDQFVKEPNITRIYFKKHLKACNSNVVFKTSNWLIDGFRVIGSDHVEYNFHLPI